MLLLINSFRSRTAVAPLERLKILLQVGTYALTCCILHTYVLLTKELDFLVTGMHVHVQVQNPHNIKYNGTIQGLKYIWRTEGFRGLFKGNGTNCARIVPNSAVKFFSYEQASKYELLF